MKIAVYCQHVLGIGHLHRTMEICRVLCRKHEVTMICGGDPIEIAHEPFDVYQLPGLMMDTTFNNLSPCDPDLSLEEVKEQRKEKLFGYFQNHRVDIFLVELYPFGRRAFRFELDPVLEAIRQKQLPKCDVICSLRDILVERKDIIKFEERIVQTLNASFDGLLIHGDRGFIPLDETFSRMNDLRIPVEYTGYVTPGCFSDEAQKLRKELHIKDHERLIVGSIGGGNVGGDLLFHLADCFEKMQDNNLHLHLFTGPYLDDESFSLLKKHESSRIQVHRFTHSFITWLCAADLSVSMAGYNTTMNILAAGIPALFFPFKQNREQAMRVERLLQIAPIKIISRDDLQPAKLTCLLTSQLKKQRYDSPINLAGADNTLKYIDSLH